MYKKTKHATTVAATVSNLIKVTLEVFLTFCFAKLAVDKGLSAIAI
jgi:hypothetical protein